MKEDLERLAQLLGDTIEAAEQARAYAKEAGLGYLVSCVSIATLKANLEILKTKINEI